MWYKIKDDYVELYVYAKPNAKRSVVVGCNEQGLNIALHAKPQEGEANKELVRFLAQLLKLPKSQIILQRGEASRYKCVRIPLTQTVKQFLLSPREYRIEGK